jgi:hypothetical protein
MSASWRTPDRNSPKQDGPIQEQEDDVVWQIIKAIQSARAGQVQIINNQDSTVVDIREAGAVRRP